VGSQEDGRDGRPERDNPAIVGKLGVFPIFVVFFTFFSFGAIFLFNLELHSQLLTKQSCKAEPEKESESTMKSNDITLTQVDVLGNLLAQIAELTKQADAIKDEIKDSASMGGAKVVEGNLFKATYMESNRSTVDHKTLYADLGITADQIAKYTKTTAVFSVKVTSR
jgi:hypothetical protein